MEDQIATVPTEDFEDMYSRESEIVYTPEEIDEYVVFVKSAEDWPVVHDYIINENEIDGIPNRKIECINDEVYSAKSGIYKMSVEEVEMLRNHPKVQSVSLNQLKYPQPLSEHGFVIKSEGDDPKRWNKDVTYYKPFSNAYYKSNASPSYSNGVRSNWSHLFLNTSDSTPFRGSNILNDNQQIESDTAYNLTGKDVDIIIIDGGVSVLHPEFIAPDGTYRVRDLLLDGPYYLDKSLFDSRNWTTTASVDSTNLYTTGHVYNSKRWWGIASTSNRSLLFTSYSYGTNPGIVSGLWYGFAGSYYNHAHAFTKNGTYGGSTQTSYPITSGHGTAAASLAGGKSFGLAFNANIWTARYDYVGVDTMLRLATIFHKAKVIAAEYAGTIANPTIVSASLGADVYCGNLTGTTYNYKYRGTNTTYSGNGVYSSTGYDAADSNWTWADSTHMPPSGSGPCQTPGRVLVRTSSTGYSWMNSASKYPLNGTGQWSEGTSGYVESLIDAGAVMVVSAANNNQKLSDKDDGDFDNQYGGTSTVSSSSDYMNRVQGLQKGFSGDHEKGKGSIRVGAIAPGVEGTCGKQGSTAYKSRKIYYSANGPMVNIWAPTDCLAAGYANYETFERLDDSNYYDAFFGGTSASCPNVASLIALYLEWNREATHADVVTWLDTVASKENMLSDPYSSTSSSNYWHPLTTNLDSYGNTWTDYPDNEKDSYNRRGSGNLRGAPNKVLYNPFVNGTVSDRPEVKVFEPFQISMS